MTDRITLTYIASDAIVSYLAKHPIDWTDRGLAGLGAPGDLMTPTPAMAVFFELLALRGSLFSQQEYVNYAFSLPEWAEWLDGLPPLAVRGIRARLGCNFYVPAIDSQHVWGMLVEEGRFNECTVDTVLDAVGKTDITVTSRGGTRLSIALAIDSPAGREAYRYKQIHRGVAEGAIVLWLPLGRPKGPGNKRWYCREDLVPVLEAAVQADPFWGPLDLDELARIQGVEPVRDVKSLAAPIWESDKALAEFLEDIYRARRSETG